MKHPTTRTMKTVLTISTITMALVTILIAIVFVNRLTLPYNSEGRSFDESSLTVYHEQAITAYGLFLLSGLLLTLLTFYKTRKAFYK